MNAIIFLDDGSENLGRTKARHIVFTDCSSQLILMSMGYRILKNFGSARMMNVFRIM
jgi:hypothetical protein